MSGSGPQNCPNCKTHGTIGGVFIGYCANCRKYNNILLYGRNHGPIGVSVSSSSYQELVEEFPYMLGAIIEQIGLQGYGEDDDNESEEDNDEETNSSMPSLIEMSENSHDDNKMTIHKLEEEESQSTYCSSETYGSSQSYTDDEEEVVGKVDEALIEGFEKPKIPKILNEFLEGIIGRKEGYY